MNLFAAYILCGCALAALSEILDGASRQCRAWGDLFEDVVFTVLAWPWILLAIYRNAAL